LTLINSKVLRNGSPGGGGGIDNGLVGTLTLTDSSVSENSSGYFGGGIFGGGQVTLANSVVTGNAAPYGGGIACWPAMTLTLIDSTVSGNTAHRVGGAGGVAAWGGASGGISCGGLGQVTLTNSTVSGNTAEGPAGGIFGGWQVTLTNSTVSGNTAESGSAIFQNGGTLTLLNSTVSGSVHAQPAVSDFGPPSPASVVTTATLIAGACTQEGDLVTWTSNGYNIESPGETCGFDEAKGDQFNVTEGQLNLGELANNGGPTMTHALLTVPVVSAAIDQIPAADCVDADGEPLIEDQRGERRPETGDTMCDVGSFEVQP
jgi:predicted outer membrane repeat protein